MNLSKERFDKLVDMYEVEELPNKCSFFIKGPVKSLNIISCFRHNEKLFSADFYGQYGDVKVKINNAEELFFWLKDVVEETEIEKEKQALEWLDSL